MHTKFLTQKERIEILILRRCGDKKRTYEQVVRQFNNTHPDRLPICKSTVCKTVFRFQDTGSVNDRSKSGRPKMATNEDNSLEVCASVVEDVHTSVRKIAQQTGIGKSSVHQILKGNKFHPYKIKYVQELSEDDFDRRLEFCEEMMRRCDENELFPFWIYFSDEATFQLSGEVNRHNFLLFGSRVVTILNYFSFNASMSDDVFNTLFFKKARKQLSRGFKSSELGGHSVEPLLSIQGPGKMLYNRAHNQTEMTRGYIPFKQDMKCMYVPAIFRIGGIIWLVFRY